MFCVGRYFSFNCSGGSKVLWKCSAFVGITLGMHILLTTVPTNQSFFWIRLFRLATPQSSYNATATGGRRQERDRFRRPPASSEPSAGPLCLLPATCYLAIAHNSTGSPRPPPPSPQRSQIVYLPQHQPSSQHSREPSR